MLTDIIPEICGIDLGVVRAVISVVWNSVVIIIVLAGIADAII